MRKIKLITVFCITTLFQLITIYSYSSINYISVEDTVITNPYPIEGINYFEMDVNNDGTIDFKIGAKYYKYWEGNHPPYDSFVIFTESVGQNKMDIGPIMEGEIIGSANTYTFSSFIYGTEPVINFTGSWPSGLNDVDAYAYIGLEFNYNNNTYYGWIKMKANRHSFTISGYAWNDMPSQPVLAGQTQ